MNTTCHEKKLQFSEFSAQMRSLFFRQTNGSVSNFYGLPKVHIRMCSCDQSWISCDPLQAPCRTTTTVFCPGRENLDQCMEFHALGWIPLSSERQPPGGAVEVSIHVAILFTVAARAARKMLEVDDHLSKRTCLSTNEVRQHWSFAGVTYTSPLKKNSSGKPASREGEWHSCSCSRSLGTWMIILPP